MSSKAQVPAQLPNPLLIEGPWDLTFPEGLGAPERVTLQQLISWSDHSLPGVKYFSGTAAYHRKFEAPKTLLAPDRLFCLDLGRVAMMAQVKLERSRPRHSVEAAPSVPMSPSFCGRA